MQTCPNDKVEIIRCICSIRMSVNWSPSGMFLATGAVYDDQYNIVFG